MCLRPAHATQSLSVILVFILWAKIATVQQFQGHCQTITSLFTELIYIEQGPRNLAFHEGCQDNGYMRVGAFEICWKWADHYWIVLTFTGSSGFCGELLRSPIRMPSESDGSRWNSESFLLPWLEVLPATTLVDFCHGEMACTVNMTAPPFVIMGDWLQSPFVRTWLALWHSVELGARKRQGQQLEQSDKNMMSSNEHGLESI